MKNIIKFVGAVVGIIATSVVIDKLIDKVYEGVAGEHGNYIDVEGESVDVSASTCKTVVKAVVGVAAITIIRKVDMQKSFIKGFEVGANNGYILGAGAHASSGEELKDVLRVGADRETMTLIVNKIKEVSRR